MTRQRLSDEQWRELVAEQRAGGVGVTAFCQQRGIAVSTFFARRRSLDRPGKQEDSAVPRFVEVTTAAEGPGAERAERAEVVEAGGNAGGVELILRRGVAEIVIRVGAGFDAALLRRVVEVLS